AREKGYMIIRFWKDRTVENSSEILAGTYTELREQLLGRMRVVETVENNMPHISPDWVMRRSQPRVFMYFLEDMADVEPGYSPVQGKIGFRIMDKTDNPESPLPKITKADLNQLAKKIKTLFFDGGGYVWKKGKEMYVYHHWEQGYQLQLLCRGKAVALEIINKILAIQNNTYIATRFKSNLTEDEATAYPTIPRKITVLGEEIDEPRKRPIAEVRFQYASIYLNKWPRPIALVNTKGETLPHFVNF
ncbi:hypothetical protein, partial [Dapis sp. BLCC M172]|uniref:hypothetical protein n=1 Tax=Dapis sp. BLCC M172 TaxID=2975281 RepID=UPI003CE8D24B